MAADTPMNSRAEVARTALGIIACFDRDDDEGIEALLSGLSEDDIVTLCEMLTAISWAFLQKIEELGGNAAELLRETALKFSEFD